MEKIGITTVLSFLQSSFLLCGTITNPFSNKNTFNKPVHVSDKRKACPR